MRFRLGLGTGFAVGYYLGARAGRERYEEINRTIDRIRGSDAFGTASEKARAGKTQASAQPDGEPKAGGKDDGPVIDAEVVEEKKN